jgi:hypothetical protein
MIFFSSDLIIAFLLSIIGLILQFIHFNNKIEHITSNSHLHMWSTILGRFFYEKNGYYGLIHFSICDFYITVLLLFYISIMVLKFFGYHLTKNKKISGHHFNDLFLIGLFCVLCRLSAFYVYN